MQMKKGIFNNLLVRGTAKVCTLKVGKIHANIKNQIVFYEDGTLTVKTKAGIPATIIVPFDCSVIEVYGYVETAPTGSAIIVDVNLNGTSIWATNQSNRLTISDGSQTGSSKTFDTSKFKKDDRLTIDIDQVGSGTAGKDLSVCIRIVPKGVVP
jgi:hypothetical protein